MHMGKYQNTNKVLESHSHMGGSITTSFRVLMISATSIKAKEDTVSCQNVRARAVDRRDALKEAVVHKSKMTT